MWLELKDSFDAPRSVCSAAMYAHTLAEIQLKSEVVGFHVQHVTIKLKFMTCANTTVVNLKVQLEWSELCTFF